MGAGKYRHLVTIQKKVKTQTPTYQTEYTWQTVQQVWASIEPLSGEEVLKQGMAEATQSVEIETREYISGVTTKDRVEDADGAVYDINNVLNPKGQRKHLQLVCTLGQS